MILPINNFITKKASFKGENDITSQKFSISNDELMKNSLRNRLTIPMEQTAKAFLIYPINGLKGDVNSNFYEFLTMGIVPYIVGSATLMSVFASPHEYLGKKMGLGVLMYAAFKSLSKNLINTPVKLVTGIDTQLPYKKEVINLPDSNGHVASPKYEYHKIGESVEFTRWDLLYGTPTDRKNMNKIFDKIAKKNGFGENLNDSDQEVKPMYKEVLVKSTLARRISSYLWGAVGVALAFQKPLEKYFNVATAKFWKTKEFGHSMKVLGESLVESAKELYKGPVKGSKIEKYSGKAIIALAAASTILGVLNAIHVTKKPSKVKGSDVIDPKRESVVS